MKKLAVASIGFGGSGRKAERRIDGRTAVARMEFGRRPAMSCHVYGIATAREGADQGSSFRDP
eukprot:2571846-Prymnesium_polylepis.1